MADITMCKGKTCELKEWCHRYTADKSKYMQTWFFTPPFYVNEIGEHQCVFYWPNEKQKK